MKCGPWTFDFLSIAWKSHYQADFFFIIRREEVKRTKPMETIATGEPSARETDAVPAPLRSIEKDEEQPVMLPGGWLLRRRARALRLLRMRRDWSWIRMAIRPCARGGGVLYCWDQPSPTLLTWGTCAITLRIFHVLDWWASENWILFFALSISSC